MMIMCLVNYFRTGFLGVVGTVACVVLVPSLGKAEEIRIVDERGLVRVVKITRGAVKVLVTLESKSDTVTAHGECRAINVDGLAAEKRVQVSEKGECVFQGVTGGSWQITVPPQFQWRVQLYE